MTKLTKKHIQLFYLAIFSGLALFSYFLLINFTNIPENSKVNWSSYSTLGFFVFAFNTLGFTIIHTNAWINKRSPLFFIKKPRIVIHLGAIAGLLFIINYGLVVLARFLAGAANIFILQFEGFKIFLLVWFIELIVVSLLVANETFSYTLRLYKQASQLSEESNRARFLALQNQLNPHFLFNSLNTLISEIEYNPGNAVAFTSHLSDVYRYILHVQDKTVISLKEELDFLDSYLFLHRVRLGECIFLDIQFDTDLYDRKVPPLTLQLLAENVIKHNTISMRSPMTITIRYDEIREILEISNPINPRKGNIPSGKGLSNLDSRYKLLIQSGIEISDTKEYFTVSVPLLYE